MVSAPSLGELASLSGGTIYQGQDVTVEAIGLVAQELAPGGVVRGGTRDARSWCDLCRRYGGRRDSHGRGRCGDPAEGGGDSPNPGSSACAFGVGDSVCPGVWGSVAAVDHDRYYGNLR